MAIADGSNMGLKRAPIVIGALFYGIIELWKNTLKMKPEKG